MSDDPDPAAIVARVEQLLGVRLEPWQAKVLHDFYVPGRQPMQVTHSMRRGDWVATKLLVEFTKTLMAYDRYRQATWKLVQDFATLPLPDGMISHAWTTDRLEHLARYGCPGPQAGRPCIHDDSQAWSP